MQAKWGLHLVVEENIIIGHRLKYESIMIFMTFGLFLSYKINIVCHAMNNEQ